MQRVRVGGQALPDGVLMRTDRAWAVARSDGRVTGGVLAPRPFPRVPVVRVVASLGPALVMGLRGGGRGQPRQVPWRMLLGLAAAELAVIAADGMVGRAGLGRSWSPIVAAGSVVLAMGVFRAMTPAAQWRFHGAEHKAVTAYERGVDLTDVAAVLTCSRVHPRCGTNLIAWLAVVSAWLSHLSLAPQLGASIFGIAVTAEVLSFAAQRPTAWLSRLLRLPGELLQLVITTSEPSLTEQEVGCVALRACLERHAAASGSGAASQEYDQEDHQDEHEGSSADVHDVYVPRSARRETTTLGGALPAGAHAASAHCGIQNNHPEPLVAERG